MPASTIDRFRGEYEFLSNFYPAKLMFDGIAYYSSETAYQAQKLEDPEQRKLLASMYADESKRYFKHIDIRPDWDEIKLQTMGDIVKAKFEQNPRLAKLLSDTVDSHIIEGNTWGDMYWGVDLKTGIGENHLGRILMELRKQILDGNLSDNSHLRPIREYTFHEHIHLTDEHIEDISSFLTVVEAGSKSLPCIKTGCAAQLDASTIQTVTPVYGRDDGSLLTISYKNCLDIAVEVGATSIAFPPLSTGKNCFPKEKASGIAVNAVLEWITNNHCPQMDIWFSANDKKIFDCLLKHLEYKSHG